MLFNIILIIVGFVFLIKGADFLVDGSSKIAKKFNIPNIVIGLTIVSIGTSMPELFVSVTSAIGGHSDMALGNVIGSNICNLLLILGLSSFINPVKFQKETRLIEIPMCLVFTLVFLVLCNTDNFISRGESLVLIILFVIFIGYTIFMGVRGNSFNEDKNNKQEKEEISIIENIVLVVIGVVALKFGGDFVVDGAVYIAQKFNVSDAIISLTILAVGTSLPELVTSVTAAIKKNSDIAIGNIIGSNIFNLLLIIGTSSLISPITYNASYNIEMAILVLATFVLALFPIIPPKNEMSRMNGVVYLIFYIIYMVILFIF